MSSNLLSIRPDRRRLGGPGAAAAPRVRPPWQADRALDQTRRLGHDAGGAAAASQTRRRPGSRADRRGRRLVLGQGQPSSGRPRVRRGQEDRRHQTAHPHRHHRPAPRSRGHRRQRTGPRGPAPTAGRSQDQLPEHRPATRELADQTGIDIEIVSGPKPPPGSGFLVQPRRWGVERTHAWINRNRRIVRQWEWEATLEAHTGFLLLSQIAVPLRRLPGFVDRL